MINMKKTVLGAAMAMAFSAGGAQAMGVPVVTSLGNNFTMVSASNGLTGGTNDVTFTWDGTYRTAVVTDKSWNATLSSPSDFSGKFWTAHHVNIYAPGSYTFGTNCTISQTPTCAGTAAQQYKLTVGANQVGAHMLFNWSTSTNIDVVLLWNKGKSWAQTGTTSAFCAGLGAQCNGVGGNTVNTVWSWVSIDTPASTISSTNTQANETNTYSGTQMIDGPFIAQSANFNVMVPVPAAAWLLGSGLLGLVGVARRKAA